MDSLERLTHSLEAGISLIQSLRRENRELAKEAGDAKSEALRISQEPRENEESKQRAGAAELESARLAEQLEEERQGHLAHKREAETRIHDLELRLLAAERDETMPSPDRSQEVESLSRRCAELEVMLAEAQSTLEKSKGDITSMQVRIAESADAEEVESWQQRMHLLSTEVEGLRHLAGMKEKLELEKAEVKRQKKGLANIAAEREMTRRKLEEIYGLLDNLRLS